METPPKKAPRVPHELDGKTTSELDTMLQDVTTKSPNIRNATQVLRALIRDRQIHPKARHYKALILANTDPERGHPDMVRSLLAEMEDNGITADSGTLHAALQVRRPRNFMVMEMTMIFLNQAVAVHPDYLLRKEILHKLRDRWLPLSPAGWHFVVAGLLRDHQFELALEQVSVMERKGIIVDNWLHSMIIYILCDFKEFDEVHSLMRARVNQHHEMTPELWLHVLDEASENLHFETTAYVWKHIVELGHLHPHYKICSNVLSLASHHGDPELGNSVFRYLTENKVPLRLADYERLTEADAKAGNLSAAFEVLCKMYEAGITVEESSTQAILEYMKQNKFDHREAWQILKRLKNANRTIPIGCVRPIAELCDHLAAHDPSVVDDAVGFYKELYMLCPGADVRVYNALISMCRRAHNREAGMFLVKEMASLEVVPDGETFEAIILMCLDAGNFQSAYMYFQDLVKRDGSLSKETKTEIRDMCAKSVDEYALRLQYHPRLRSDVQAAAECKQGRGHIFPRAIRRKLRSFRTNEGRRAWNKLRRQNKRRRLAIARKKEKEGMKEEAGAVDDGSAKSGE